MTDIIRFSNFDGPSVRAELVAAGIIRPGADGPTLGAWHAEPPTLRLLHDDREARAHRTPLSIRWGTP